MQKKARRFTRRTPDLISEELVAVLSEGTWFEFKPLFLVIQTNLRARNAAGGDAEMLRLRTYEKLQNLVQHGAVEKLEKQYRGVPSALKAYAEQVAAQNCRTLVQTVKASVAPETENVSTPAA